VFEDEREGVENGLQKRGPGGQAAPGCQVPPGLGVRPGLHGARNRHGTYAPQIQRFMCTVLTDFDKKKKLAKKLMGMKED